MTVKELIERLEAVPANWEVIGTGNGSLHIWDAKPDDYGYGYVFPDGRDTLLLTDRRKRALRAREQNKEKVNG